MENESFGSLPNAPESEVFRMAMVNILGGLSFGYIGIGINGPSQLAWACAYDLSHDTPGDVAAIGLLASFINVGAMVGALAGGAFLNKIGAVRGVLCSALLSCTTGFSIIAPTFSMQLLARLVAGLGVGMVSSACPTYVAETAPKEQRGSLGALFQVSLCFGILLSAIAGYFALGPNRDMVALDFCAAEGTQQVTATLAELYLPGVMMPAALALLVILGVPRPESEKEAQQTIQPPPLRYGTTGDTNSPRNTPLCQTSSWYVGKLVKERSRATLGSSSFVLKHDLLYSEEDDLDVLEVGKEGLAKAFILGTVMACALQLTGINAVVFYSASFFEAAGMKKKSLGAIILMTWNLLSTLFAMFMADRFGRRRIILPALLVQATAIILLGGVSYIDAVHNPALTFFKTTTSFLLLFSFLLGFQAGPGSLFWVICAEIFPPQCSTIGFVLVNTIQWVFCLLVTACFGTLTRIFGPTVFVFFGVFGIFSFSYLYLCLPETKDTSKAALAESLENGPWITFGKVEAVSGENMYPYAKEFSR